MKTNKLSAAVSGIGAKAAALGTTLMVTAGSALAQDAPDVSAITTELNTYKIAVVGLVIAFCVVLWAKRGAGLLKPGG